MRRALILAAFLASAVAARAEGPKLDAHRDGLLKLYTDLHRAPELSMQEVKTSARMADELRKAGAEVTTGVGKLGVVGILKNGPGPVALVRADMDGLPVAEETGLPYASTAKGVDPQGREVPVMHACGHDVHMTTLVGVANWLADHKDRWGGTVVLVAQPAEERIAGARAMLEDGLYSRFPKPDFALALHCMADGAVGDVYYRAGPMLANSTAVDVTIRGRGGHGSMPDKAVDPIPIAALAVLDYQTIVSRDISPLDPAVVTVGSIHGGLKHNVIPDEVKLELTLRSYKESVRLALIEGIERRTRAISEAHRAPEPTVEVVEHTPETSNDPDLVARVIPLLREALGADHVMEAQPVMGSEDFALYAQDGVPIMMLWLGSVPAERIQAAKDGGPPLPGLHSNKYQPEAEGSIAVGVRAMTAAVSGLLPPKSRP
jgi:amidohydrolase